ncbi:MAG: hypothetical protein WB217_06990, partial [Mesobacillus sp.]
HRAWADWEEAYPSPAGLAAKVRPPGAKRRGGSPDAPRKASAWSGNQQTGLTPPNFLKRII